MSATGKRPIDWTLRSTRRAERRRVPQINVPPDPRGSTFRVGVGYTGFVVGRGLDRWRIALGSASLAWTVGCPATDGGDEGQATEGASASSRICDGTDALRLVVRGGPGEEASAPAERFANELGTEYLYVTGTCTYFVRPAHALAAHTGTLDAATETALADALAFDELAALEGVYPDDAGSLVSISDGTHTVACGNDCDGATAGVRAAVRSWTQQLWETGVAYDGPLRVVVNARQPSDLSIVDADAWQGTSTLAALAYPTPFEYWVGSSTVLADLNDTAWLRQVVDTADSPMVTFVEGPSGAEVAYEVWIRDALPFENALGLVAAPVPCGSCNSAGSSCVDGYCQGAACTDACDILTPCVDGQCLAQ